MKIWMTRIARILLGLVFVGAGIAAIMNHFAFPPDLPPGLAQFTQGFAASRYFMPLLKYTEVTCGILLISGYFVPLALVVLAPIIVNIVFTHAFLAHSGLPLALVLLLLEIYLAFFASPYRERLRPLFSK